MEQLTQDGDIPEALARCVVDRFFAERTDEELARFMEDPEATRAELDEFAALTTVCAAELRPATT